MKIFISKYKFQLLFFSLFGVFLFLRFHQFYERGFVGWDQADSAWGAYRILHENFFTLQGVPMKGNAGMYLGPLYYYYLITPFYFFTNQDMSASLIFAGVVGVISFIIFLLITKNLFNNKVALVASFFYIFAIDVIRSDRLQAAYVLIPTISYIVFYFLYKVLQGEEKYLLYLSAVIGFGFHVHFTTIFLSNNYLIYTAIFPENQKVSFIWNRSYRYIFTFYFSSMVFSISY